ncbi:MAG: hypothetical protein C1943_03800 [Halochromatium sp.]|nr:hypothetical protein [Halochromatium sp.]
MKNHLNPVTGELGRNEIKGLSIFCKTEWEPSGLGTEQTLRWAMRHRHTNGLVEFGAVIEKYMGTGKKKPRLFINVPRFYAWLATTDTAPKEEAREAAPKRANRSSRKAA